MKRISSFWRILFLLIFSGFISITPSHSQTVLFTDGFESAQEGQVPPAGWGIEVLELSDITWFLHAGQWPIILPYEGNRLVEFQSFNTPSGINRLKRIIPLSTAGYPDITVDFAWYTDNGWATCHDRVVVEWSLDDSTWHSAGTFQRYSSNSGWVIERQQLPDSTSGVPSLYIAFLFIANYGNNCHLDYVQVKSGEILGSPEKEPISWLNLYPNPTTGPITLEFNTPVMQKTEIRILDNTGRQVREYNLIAASNITKQNIDLGDLSSGNYWVVVTEAGQKIIRELTVLH